MNIDNITRLWTIKTIKNESKVNQKWRSHILVMKRKQKHAFKLHFSMHHFVMVRQGALEIWKVKIINTYLFLIFLQKTGLKTTQLSFLHARKLSFLPTFFSQVQVVVLSFIRERLSISSTNLWFDEKNQSQCLHNFAHFRFIFLVKCGKKAASEIWKSHLATLICNMYMLLTKSSTNSETINPNFLIN